MLDQTVSIRRLHNIRDQYGAVITVSDDIITGMKVRIVGISGRERALYGSRGVEVTHIMLCRVPSSNMTEKDQVVAGDLIYEIQFIDKVHGSVGIDHLECVLTEMRDDGGLSQC